MPIDQQSSLSNVVRLAQVEGQTHSERTMTYGRTATSRATRDPIMLIDNVLNFERDGYNTGPPRPLQRDTSPLLLMPSTERGADDSTTPRYRTANGGLETPDITEKIQRLLPLRIPPLAEPRVREACAMLTQDDSGISC